MANKIPRVPVREQDPKERAHNFEEVCFGYDDKEAALEASRCLDCKKPRCMEGCPVSIHIPEFIRNIVAGDIKGAAAVIVPRHLHRVRPWQERLEDLGLRPLLLSELGEASRIPASATLVWDRFGDLPALYGKAAAVFVGGSFGQGGQNFLEALSAGIVPCIGPSASNFLWAMDRSGGLPSLEEAGLLHVLKTPKAVVETMLMQAGADRSAFEEGGLFSGVLRRMLSCRTDAVSKALPKEDVMGLFEAWLEPRKGGSALASRVIMERLARSL